MGMSPMTEIFPPACERWLDGIKPRFLEEAAVIPIIHFIFLHSVNMSQTRRNDLRSDSDVTFTDDAGKFKKAFQTIGRPEVTKGDIHEEYMRHPPNVNDSALAWPAEADRRMIIFARTNPSSL